MSRRDKVKVITKQFIIDQLTDNEVDLSMNELSDVPVKELALVTRGTRLDLSRNHLKKLPENFGTLRHLIGLDLSGNKLQELPDTFGNLVLLQRLDLYSNQLTSLPLSFYNLKKLKWLDLKNNPLESGLREAAGTCVSSKECNMCATKVLAYMRHQNCLKQEALEKKRLHERIKREEEALKRGAIKKEREMRKRLREEQLRRLERGEEEEEEEEEGEDEEEKENDYYNHRYRQYPRFDNRLGVEKKGSLSVGSVCTTLLLLSITIILLIVIGVMLCNNFFEPSQCQAMKMSVIKYVAKILELLGAKVD